MVLFSCFRCFVFSPDVPIRLDYHGKRVDMEQVRKPFACFFSFDVLLVDYAPHLVTYWFCRVHSLVY